MIKEIEIEGFNCTCVNNDDALQVNYMIYPQVNPFTDEWLESQALKNSCSIVVVYVPLSKWNDCLTPWPAPGETPKAEPFAGAGREFLEILQQKIIPEAEVALGIQDNSDRNLVGVSLGGLFTLWQWMLCDTFKSIACLSGSFWYEGFIDWFDKQSVPQKNGRAYFFLGTEEPKAHIKAYRTVGVNTETVVSRLKDAGIDTTLDWVAGNHFANPLQRAEKALALIGSSGQPDIVD